MLWKFNVLHLRVVPELERLELHALYSTTMFVKVLSIHYLFIAALTPRISFRYKSQASILLRWFKSLRQRKVDSNWENFFYVPALIYYRDKDYKSEGIWQRSLGQKKIRDFLFTFGFFRGEKITHLSKYIVE